MWTSHTPKAGSPCLPCWLTGQRRWRCRTSWTASRWPPRKRTDYLMAWSCTDTRHSTPAAQDIHVIARSMDVVGQNARYRFPEPPHSVVLQHLLERVDECVTTLGEYALVIADEVDGQAKHRTDLSSYRDVGTTGYRRRRLTRIVDTLHFAPSHASRLVQAADVIAFLYRRGFTHRETDERSRKTKVSMWKRLEPRVHHELCWFPSPTRGNCTCGDRTFGNAQR